MSFTKSCSKPLITMNTSAKFVDFKEVKASVNILQVLKHYGFLESLKKEPPGYAGPCPFCESTGRAFRASEEKNCFNCWNCKAKGNVLDFVQQRESCTIRNAALKLVDWFNLGGSSVPVSPKKKNKQEKGGTKAKKKEGGKPTTLGFTLKLDSEHPWFEEAGVSPETVSEFGLGFCDKGILEGCIAFPIHDADQGLVGYAGYDLSSPSDGETPQWRYPKNLPLDEVIYNISRIDPSVRGAVALAFDPLDLVRKWQKGEKRAVAILGGTVSRSQLLILESLL